MRQIGHAGRQEYVRLSRCLALFLCLATGAAVSVALGQDANWDLRNYHLYAGYAALNGRFETDLAAAGLQSWMNPVLDIPYAWLALGPFAQHPRFLAAFMGLWYGLLIAADLAIAWMLYDGWPQRQKWLAILVAAGLGASGAAVVSQIGTTFNEVQTGTLVLTGVLLLGLALPRSDHDRLPFRYLLCAGGLLGLASGLKLTAALYSPAACLALAAVLPWRRWMAWCSLVIAGWIAGFAAGGGYWSYRLLEKFRNPAFPYLNGVFHSDWYPPVNFFDRRFLPEDGWHAAFYPLYWMVDGTPRVTENPLRDGRIGVAYILCLTAVFMALVLSARNGLRHTGKSALLPFTLTAPQSFLLAFLAISYALWLSSFSILRYAIPIEAACGLLIPLLMAVVLRTPLAVERAGTWSALVALVAIAIATTTHYPHWGRADYGKRVVSADLSWVRPHTLIVLVGSSVSYVAPFAPRNAGISFIGLTDVVFEARGFKLADEVLRRIRTHRGPVVIVWAPDSNWRLPTLLDMGLETVQSSCRRFYASYEASMDRWFHACDGKITNPPLLNDPFWLQAANHYREIAVPQPTPGWSYFGFTKSVGEAARGKDFADVYEYLWSRMPGRPKEFDEKLFPDTLYILNPALRDRALRAMNRKTDLLAEIDDILVLAPGWRRCRSCIIPPGQITPRAAEIENAIIHK